MNATGWSRGLEVTSGGTGVVSHAGLVLLRELADRTGLTGRYYFGFKFRSLMQPREDADAADLFAAVQEELGLRLEKEKLPVEFVVVDRLEKPSEN